MGEKKEKLRATKIKKEKTGKAAEVGQARVKQLMHTGYVSAANGFSLTRLLLFLYPLEGNTAKFVRMNSLISVTIRVRVTKVGDIMY